jgi:hypothetical protein
MLIKCRHGQNQWVMNSSQCDIKNMDILNLLIFNISQKSFCKLLASIGVESTKNRSFLHHKSLILKLPALNEKVPECWLSYNAVLRASKLGYTNLY